MSIAKRRSQPVRHGAFDQGDVPRIACFSQAKTPLRIGLPKLLAAMQKFLDDVFVPVWGTPARLALTTGFVKGMWALVFLDDADTNGALAYHDLTPDGFPLSKIFVRTIRDAGSSLSVAASHELAEMLVDPAINLMSTGPDKKAVYCYETADPVEESSFKVDGVAMTDFVYPSYFETFRKPRSARFDHLGKVSRPFELLSGGYQIVFKSGKWSQLHGSSAKARSMAEEDRRGHRADFRRMEGVPLVTSRERESKAPPPKRWGRVIRVF